MLYGGSSAFAAIRQKAGQYNILRHEVLRTMTRRNSVSPKKVNMKRFLKAVAGFTLIELIVTLALLAIAASIATPIILSGINKREEESQRQACINIFELGTNIADAYTKGSRSISGTSIDPNNPAGGILGVAALIAEENSLSYKIDIAIKSNATNPSVNYSKDTVVLYFWYGTDTGGNPAALAVGCWYMVKGKTTPQYKYDYDKGKIEVSTGFTTPNVG